MKRSSWIMLSVIILLAGGLVVLRTAGTDRRTDEEKIHELLAKAQSAIQRKDTSTALSCVSRQYSDAAGNNFDKLRMLTIRGFRTTERYTVFFDNVSIGIDGDNAQVDMQAYVNASAGPDSVYEIFNAPVTLSLARKTQRRWLIFSDDKWLIASISNLPSGGDDLL